MSGGIVLLGDLQAEHENLELCQGVVDQAFGFAKREHARAVVILGDLKQRYNPVDVRVTNFVTETLARFVQEGFLVFVLLGNHDRIGMYSDESWLPALRHTGATICDAPNVYAAGNYSLFMLPYRAKPEEQKAAADTLSQSVRYNKGIKILCYHCGLREANYAENFIRNRETLSLKDLKPELYDYVLGGHIHWHQKIGENAWYVGSLFATDWNEVNQTKVFAYVE